MRAGRLGRLAGLVVAMAALVMPAYAASGGFSTMDYEWTAPATTAVVSVVSAGSGASSTTIW